MSDEPHLDWLLIDLVRTQDTSALAEYEYSCAVFGSETASPRRRASGRFVIYKSSGVIEPVSAMPEDVHGSIWIRATSHIRRYWKKGSLPPNATYAAG